MDAKEYAKRMLEKYDINMFSQELDIFNSLNQIIDGKQETETNIEELKIMEKKLDNKVKMQNLQELYDFLEKLTKNLKFQKIRKTDYGEEEFRVIYFKVKDNRDKEYVFLTRKYLEEYVNNHKNKFNTPNIIEVESQENIELNNLLNMIIKNFI